jgi:hypothetical protein
MPQMRASRTRTLFFALSHPQRVRRGSDSEVGMKKITDEVRKAYRQQQRDLIHQKLRADGWRLVVAKQALIVNGRILDVGSEISAHDLNNMDDSVGLYRDRRLIWLPPSSASRHTEEQHSSAAEKK